MSFRPTFKFVESEEELFSMFEKHAGYVSKNVYNYFDIYANDTHKLFQKMKDVWQREREGMKINATQKRALKLLREVAIQAKTDDERYIFPRKYGFYAKTFEVLADRWIARRKSVWFETGYKFKYAIARKP